jgi:hypothetical protein
LTLETDSVLTQIDALLARAGVAPGAPPTRAYFGDMGTAAATRLSTGWLAAVERLCPPGSRYAERARSEVDEHGVSSLTTLTMLAGILQALRDDYEDGYVVSLTELIHADLFADFLGMAAELLDKGYKDPAAVIAGSVLEEHLRKLADRLSVTPVATDGTPHSASRLNDNLAKAGAYNKVDQKSVLAWLGLRNDAAHGKYDEYSKEQVALMLEGIRGFLIRHPA